MVGRIIPTRDGPERLEATSTFPFPILGMCLAVATLQLIRQKVMIMELEWLRMKMARHHRKEKVY